MRIKVRIINTIIDSAVGTKFILEGTLGARVSERQRMKNGGKEMRRRMEDERGESLPFMIPFCQDVVTSCVCYSISSLCYSKQQHPI